MYSLIIPVYKNRESLPDLLIMLNTLAETIKPIEIVFVVDGSPDDCYDYLTNNLKFQCFHSQLILLSRNFGSFAAIRAGLQVATGDYFAVMAADLQDPPELIINFFNALEKNEADVVLGVRATRSDPFLTRVFSSVFWFCYQYFIEKNMPKGGVDLFGCNTLFRKQLLSLTESNSSLVGLVFWLGFRRKFIQYNRLPRPYGKSAWSFRRKLNYLSDSLFSFSDLPIRLLIIVGGLGLLFSVLFGFFVFIAKITHWIALPGYAATVLIILFFAGLNSLGLGIIGSYVWRAFENSKSRPQAVIMVQDFFKEKMREY